jgi:hypothetical protein
VVFLVSKMTDVSCDNYRFHPELLFGAVNVEERRHPDEEPPPRPIPDHEKLPDVPLDAADGEILEFALGEAATGEVPPAVGLQVDDHAGETLVPLGLQLRQHPITEKYLQGREEAFQKFVFRLLTLQQSVPSTLPSGLFWIFSGTFQGRRLKFYTLRDVVIELAIVSELSCLQSACLFLIFA